MRLRVVYILFIVVPICLNVSALFSNSGSKSTQRAQFFHQSRYSFPEFPKASKLVNEYFNISKEQDLLLEQFKWEALGPFLPDATKDPVMFGLGRINVVRFDPKDPKMIYTGTASGGLWISRDAGETFYSPEITNVLSIGISDISINQHDNKMIAIATGDAHAREFQRGYSLGVMISTDQGINWKISDPFPDVPFYFIKSILWHPTYDSMLIVSTSEGVIYTDDFGITWNSLILKGVECGAMKFDKFNPDILYISTFKLSGGIGLYRYTFDTKSLDTLVSFPNIVRIEFEQIAQNKILILGAQKLTFNQGVFGIFDLSSKMYNSLQLKDVIEAQGYYNLALFADPFDETIYAGGLILNTFKLSNLADVAENEWIHKDQHHIEMNPHDSSIWVCNDGGLYRKLRNDTKWELMSKNMNISQVYRLTLHPYNPNIILAGTQDNGTFRYFYKEWTQVLGGDGMESAFDLDNPLYILMTAEGGRVAHSDDGAQSVKSDYITYSIKEPRPWLVDIHNYQGEFVTGYVNLWKINYENKSYEKLTHIDDGILMTAIYVVNDTIYFAKRNSLYSFHSGITSKILELDEQFTINSIIFNDALIFTVGGYSRDNKVYKYKNETLTSMTYNLMNIHLNRIVYDSHKQCYYLASDIGVWKLENGSEKWIPFNNQLPQCIISDIEISYNSGELLVSTFGRGVWKCKIHDCTPSEIMLNLDKNINLCEGEQVWAEILNSEANATYIWHDGIIATERAIDKRGEFHVAKKTTNCADFSKAIMVEVNPNPDISFILKSRNPACFGDTVVLEAVLRNFSSGELLWNDGSTGAILSASSNGEYFLTATNEFGCKFVSETFEVIISPTLPPVSIYKTLSGFAFESETKPFRLDWFYNDSLVSSGPEIFQPDKPGFYKLQLVDSNFCRVYSNELFVDYINQNDLFSYNLYPNPVDDLVTLEMYFNDKARTEIHIVDLLGKKQLWFDSNTESNYLYLQKNTILLASGTYTILIKHGLHYFTISFVKTI
ncbi:MAG: T9SS type A sorting domain-containing protein [Candidatus Kapabacteria bacterium]|nr:T9SS type A sorting domain-containing protein [Candidatus Kapabacteria bacterium]